MKEYEIWIEGYRATGDGATASLIGKAFGNTFEEACLNFRDGNGEPLALDEHSPSGHPSIWACQLFDNEQDARKGFG